MKFIQYLNEETKTIEEMVSILRENCGPMLKWMQMHAYKKLLRRYNSKRDGQKFELITPRKDRQPRDTPNWVQKLLDDAFEKKFNARPRSSGVFCKLLNVAEFTFPLQPFEFILFPVGEYRCIWAEDIVDLYLEWTNSIEGVCPTRKEREIKTKTWVTSIVNQYTDRDIKEAKYGEEIMLICDKYYMVSGDTYNTLRLELKEK